MTSQIESLEAIGGGSNWAEACQLPCACQTLSRPMLPTSNPGAFRATTVRSARAASACEGALPVVEGRGLGCVVPGVDRAQAASAKMASAARSHVTTALRCDLTSPLASVRSNAPRVTRECDGHRIQGRRCDETG
jgi:hypothetical protein